MAERQPDFHEQPEGRQTPADGIVENMGETAGRHAWPEELARRQQQRRERETELRGGDYGPMSAAEAARAWRSQREAAPTIRQDHPPVAVPGEVAMTPEEAAWQKGQLANARETLRQSQPPQSRKVDTSVNELTYEETPESKATRLHDFASEHADRNPFIKPH